jgi:hypothetical protein
MNNSKNHISSTSQKISSDNLYHYTNEAGLKGILRNGFKSSYCKELIIGAKKTIYLSIPMVCFCDIPFELSESHRNNFNSDYAIGLSKKWKIMNRLNSILYLNENSVLWDDISEIINLIVEMDNKKTMEIENKLCDGTSYLYNSPPEVVKLKKNLFSMVSMMKPYIGRRYDSKGNFLCDDYKFYDEREWRFVFESLPKYILTENSNLDIIKKENPINDNFLLFNIHDIRHIIVRNKSEVNEIKEILISEQKIGGNPNDYSFDITSINITSIN